MLAVIKRCILVTVLAVTFCCQTADADQAKPILPGRDVIKEQRVKEIEQMLVDKPVGLGRPINDRQAWEKLAERKDFKKIITQARKLLTEPMPAQPDELYMDYFITGNRGRYENVAFLRRDRVRTFVLAECLENKGRFLNALERTIEILCAEPTWVFPAHDKDSDLMGSKKLANFRGEAVTIDLFSSRLGWSLAAADYLLGDRLNNKTRQLIRKNLHYRLFEPFRKTATGRDTRIYWLKFMNNWNAVCLAQVTAAALAIIADKHDRAFFAAAAEAYSQNFANGSSTDGYCGEGVGYWNYGFGHYLMQAEILRQATQGKLDVLDREHIPAIACYGWRVEVINAVYPSFADCDPDKQPNPRIMSFVNKRFGFGWKKYRNVELVGAQGRFYEVLMYSFENSISNILPTAKKKCQQGLRTWFPDGCVLIARGKKGTASAFGIAAKGGHNEELHNNNDVGSFMVVVADSALLVDPGREVYTFRTGSSRRYDSKVLNSYGHSVPVVAGQLQKTGADARAVVKQIEFTDAKDTFVIDITSAYDVPQLKSLQRKFEFSRQGRGCLTVTDEVEFTEPMDFGTALITFDKWKKIGGDSLLVYDSKRALKVNIEVAGGEFQISSSLIKEDLRNKKIPVRLGIDMAGPVQHAVIKLEIRPAKRFLFFRW